MSNPDIGIFQEVEINYATEYQNIRKMMGTKGTNLGELSYNTILMYVSAPDKWLEPYSRLIEEIDARNNMLNTQALFKEIGLKKLLTNS